MIINNNVRWSALKLLTGGTPNKVSAPKKAGCYLLMSKGIKGEETTVYIGKTENLSLRLNEHGELSSRSNLVDKITNATINGQYAIFFMYSVMDSEKDAEDYKKTILQNTKDNELIWNEQRS